MNTSDRAVRRYTASHLKLADHLYDLVLSGVKTSTIRYGFVFIINELVPLRSGERSLKVRVLSLDYSKTFGSLTDADAHKDGFTSLPQLRSEMLRFYPQITDSDPVTVFHFTRVDQ